MTLEELNVPPVGGGCYCDHQVINVGENQALRDEGVEGGDVDNEQDGGDRGTLWGTHSNRSELFQRSLEEEPTLSIGEEATHPSNDVPMYPFGS